VTNFFCQAKDLQPNTKPFRGTTLRVGYFLTHKYWTELKKCAANTLAYFASLSVMKKMTNA